METLYGQSVASLIVIFAVLHASSNLDGMLVVPVSIWGIMTFAFATLLITQFDYHRFKRPKSITRQLMQVGIPHKGIQVQTADGALISAYHIHNGHKKLLIMSHGAHRSKNALEITILAQWLSTDFDIIAFDTRGHFQSKGLWTGDGKTRLDLLAILDYAQAFNYKKVGVIGRSFGAWSAMLASLETDRLDSMILIGAPLDHVRATPLIAPRRNFLETPFGKMFMRSTFGIRYDYTYLDESTPTPREIINEITVPMFFINSHDDDVTGIVEDDIRRVFETLSVPKKLHIFPEVGHPPSPWHLGSIYTMILSWFDETLSDQTQVEREQHVHN